MLPCRWFDSTTWECWHRRRSGKRYRLHLWFLWLWLVPLYGYMVMQSARTWSFQMDSASEQWDRTKTSSDSATWAYWWLLNSYKHFNSDAHFFLSPSKGKPTQGNSCARFSHSVQKKVFWQKSKLLDATIVICYFNTNMYLFFILVFASDSAEILTKCFPEILKLANTRLICFYYFNRYYFRFLDRFLSGKRRSCIN